MLGIGSDEVRSTARSVSCEVIMVGVMTVRRTLDPLSSVSYGFMVSTGELGRAVPGRAASNLGHVEEPSGSHGLRLG